MTKREMYNAIINRVADNQEMVDFLNKEIAALDARNAKASAKRSDATSAVCDAVYDALAFVNEQVTVTELIENAPNEVAEWKRQKVSYALNRLVDEGRAEKEIFKRVSYFRAVV